MSPVHASGADPQLQSAEIRVAMMSAIACEVTATLTVAGVTEVEHRLAAPEGTVVERVAVEGGRLSGEAHSVGHTQSVTVAPAQDGASYTLTYRVALSEARAYRCPLWLPTVPTDGRSRPVRIEVSLPPDASIGRASLPALTWRNRIGTGTLAHIPSAVYVPYSHPSDGGVNAGWDVAGTLDAVAGVIFVLATLVWLWRRKG